MKEFSRRVTAIVDRIALIGAAASLLLALSLALAQIVLRNAAQIGLPWIDHLLRYLVLYVAMFGAVLACHRGRHIRIGIVSNLPAHTAGSLMRLFDMATAGVCGLLCVAAYRFWISEWTHATPGSEWVAALAVILPAGFAMLSAAFVLRAACPPMPDADTAG